MGLKHVRSAGPNFAPAYQISGIPFVSSSAGNPVNTTTPKKISFPYVTRFLIVSNLSSDPLRIGFSENGVTAVSNDNYFILSGNQVTERMELRCKELFLLAELNTVEWSLVAGLTGINYDQFPVLTGTYQDSDSFEGIG